VSSESVEDVVCSCGSSCWHGVPPWRWQWWGVVVLVQISDRHIRGRRPTLPAWRAKVFVDVPRPVGAGRLGGQDALDGWCSNAPKARAWRRAAPGLRLRSVRQDQDPAAREASLASLRRLEAGEKRAPSPVPRKSAPVGRSVWRRVWQHGREKPVVPHRPLASPSHSSRAKRRQSAA